MIINNDSLHALKELEADSIDAVITDPPYGYSFMGKDWDRAVPSVEIWQECLRVLKPGGWCMVMSAPRSDVQNAMISRLMEAGFRLDFTPIYWTYASGFPKAGNVGKLVDKKAGRLNTDAKALKDRLNQLREAKGYSKSDMNRLCGFEASNFFRTDNHLINIFPTGKKWAKIKDILGDGNEIEAEIQSLYEQAEREVIGKYKSDAGGLGGIRHGQKGGDITVHATPQAKALDGSYTGFQPKPAVEVIIVAMKPLSEKTYVDQALKNGRGITWLDDCRVPLDANAHKDMGTFRNAYKQGAKYDSTKGNVAFLGKETAPNIEAAQSGRFPANLLVSDDVLNDGTISASKGNVEVPKYNTTPNSYEGGYTKRSTVGHHDSGSYSRYFDLDKWAAAHLSEQQMKTFPFAIFPKASKSEKNKGLEHFEDKNAMRVNAPRENEDAKHSTLTKNVHPTVKPLKLMSYLITLTTREGDTVLDPFVGSGTTVVAAKQLGRKGVGIEREEEYAEIARARVEAVNEAEEQLNLV